jgi:hypothetical protein
MRHFEVIVPALPLLVNQVFLVIQAFQDFLDVPDGQDEVRGYSPLSYRTSKLLNEGVAILTSTSVQLSIVFL